PSREPAAEAPGRAAEERPEAPAEEQRSEAPAGPAIDLPEPQRDAPARLPRREAEDLLGSVLDSLPQPKAAGQGRRRSRRVTTSTLTAGED
ncbi:hypothetical protein ACFSBI_11710, partial [Amnibacterium endophyticum]